MGYMFLGVICKCHMMFDVLNDVYKKATLGYHMMLDVRSHTNVLVTRYVEILGKQHWDALTWSFR